MQTKGTIKGAGRTLAAVSMLAIAVATLAHCAKAAADEVVTPSAAGASVVSSLPAGVTQPPVKIAVLPFASAGGTPFTSCSVTVAPMKDAGKRISGEVASKLAAWPEYEIIDQALVQRIAEKHHFDAKNLTDPEALRHFAQLTGASAIVTGEADGTVWSGNGHSGGNLFAAARMLSTTDGKTLWSVDGQSQSTTSQADLAPDLAANMTARLFAQLQESQSGRLLAMRTTQP